MRADNTPINKWCRNTSRPATGLLVLAFFLAPALQSACFDGRNYMYQAGLAMARMARKDYQDLSPQQQRAFLQQEFLSNLEQAASLGDGQANYSLGVIYSKGLSVAPDLPRAITYLQKAGECRGKAAELQLGVVYSTAPGDLQNWKNAVYWYGRAGEDGSADGYFNLGLIAFLGKLGPPNNQEAIRDFSMSAKLGHQFGRLSAQVLSADPTLHNYEEFIRRVDHRCQCTSADQVRLPQQPPRNEAAELSQAPPVSLKTSCNEGKDDFDRAFHDRIFIRGNEIPDPAGNEKEHYYRRDYLESLQRAANLGNGKANLQLGKIYLTGTLVPRNTSQTATYFERAAECHIAEAEHELGSMHEIGMNYPKSWPDAASWYRRAAQDGSADAYSSLGLIAFKGCLGQPDNREAIRMFEASASMGNEYDGFYVQVLTGDPNIHDINELHRRANILIDRVNENIRQQIEQSERHVSDTKCLMVFGQVCSAVRPIDLMAKGLR